MRSFTVRRIMLNGEQKIDAVDMLNLLRQVGSMGELKLVIKQMEEETKK